MSATAIDIIIITALLCCLAVSVFAMVASFFHLYRFRPRRHARESEDERVERPWMEYGWRWPLTLVERREAQARAAEVARATLGPERWSALVRDGYLDLPSATKEDTRYRLRPARRVEIRRRAHAATSDECWRASAYLCVYPTYELPAVEFMAQLYVLLRDDESRVLATGRIQRYDGSIPNVF